MSFSLSTSERFASNTSVLTPAHTFTETRLPGDGPGQFEKALEKLIMAKTKEVLKTPFEKLLPFQCQSTPLRGCLKSMKRGTSKDLNGLRPIVKLANSVHTLLKSLGVYDEVVDHSSVHAPSSSSSSTSSSASPSSPFMNLIGDGQHPCRHKEAVEQVESSLCATAEYIAKLERINESNTSLQPPMPPPPLVILPPSLQVLQEENQHLHALLASKDKEVTHLRNERERSTLSNSQMLTKAQAEAIRYKDEAAKARKTLDTFKRDLEEMERTLQSALAQKQSIMVRLKLSSFPFTHLHVKTKLLTTNLLYATPHSFSE